MAKQPALVVAALVALGVASPFFVPPELDRAFKIGLVAVCAVALLSMLRNLGGAAKTASDVALPADAVVLKEGPANYKDGWLMVGGVLKLTAEELVFSAHGFAQKAKVHRWDLRQVTSVSPARALGLVPNAILVRLGSTDIKLVVTDRESWIEQIRAAAAMAAH